MIHARSRRPEERGSENSDPVRENLKARTPKLSSAFLLSHPGKHSRLLTKMTAPFVHLHASDTPWRSNTHPTSSSLATKSRRFMPPQVRQPGGSQESSLQKTSREGRGDEL
jgi:hypothetical protein